MKELAERALNAAQLQGASYADVRIIHLKTQSILVKNGHVEGLIQNEEQGFGIRVIVNGAWGFASSSQLELDEVARMAKHAAQIARASSIVKAADVNLGPPEKHVARYQTPVKIDPFSIPLEDKIALLLAADEGMRRAKGIAVTESGMEFSREHKVFASTEGSYIVQEMVESGAGIEATAVGENEVQTRSFPNSFGRHMAKAGYEFVRGLQLVKNSQCVAEEAVALLSAAQCPTRITTLILDSTQLALQIHESCGHPTELDRVLGDEASYAGTSFLTLDKCGSFRYGSPLVNIYADATVPGALGSFGYDDEGVPAQRSPLVQDGLFVGYLTSRETAARLGQRSNGTMRADGWSRIPLIRMTNINLEPGTWEFDDLIADTDDGIYMAVNKSWSIDDKRLNFQFGTQIAYEIKHGKLGRMLKNATYTGITPEFWGSCDAICNSRHWRIWGLPNCGKGQPGQTAHVAHGAAPARFRNVHVGIA
jgi:TldD protein